MEIKSSGKAVEFDFHSSAGPLSQPLIPISFFFSLGSVFAVLE